LNIKEILHRIIKSFFIILGGSLIATFVFKLVFGTGIPLHIDDIGALIVLSVVVDLTYFIFYSRNELSRNQMLIRYIVHMMCIASELFVFAKLRRWVDFGRIAEILVFFALVITVYIATIGISNYQAEITADKLNRKLKERYKR